MKWRPTCYKIAPDKLENGPQYCCNKFDCRLFTSKFSQFALYLSLSLSVISKSLAQPCYKHCNLSVSIVLHLRFSTNKCAWRTTPLYVVRTSKNRMSTTWDLQYSLPPKCESLCICCSAFPITTMWCFEQDVKMVPGATFTKRTCNWCCSLQKGGDVVAASQLAWHWKWITTNGMCAKSNTQIYVTRTSNNSVISLGDLYCFLLPQCESLRTSRSSFLIATHEMRFLSFACPIHEND